MKFAQGNKNVVSLDLDKRNYSMNSYQEWVSVSGSKELSLISLSYKSSSYLLSIYLFLLFPCASVGTTLAPEFPVFCSQAPLPFYPSLQGGVENSKILYNGYVLNNVLVLNMYVR